MGDTVGAVSAELIGGGTSNAVGNALGQVATQSLIDPSAQFSWSQVGVAFGLGATASSFRAVGASSPSFVQAIENSRPLSSMLDVGSQALGAAEDLAGRLLQNGSPPATQAGSQLQSGTSNTATPAANVFSVSPEASTQASGTNK